MHGFILQQQPLKNSIANQFNAFIAEKELIEINMGVFRSLELGLRVPNLASWTIIGLFFLSNYNVDFGPRSFKFFNSWMLEDGLNNLVQVTWSNVDVDIRECATIRFKNKMKILKSAIKQWWGLEKDKRLVAKNELVTRLQELDKIIDNGGGLNSIWEE
uniref:Uncharacterized protein n=1 Tax=Lactuca sativa TaxID=4236 RepID=A0A9R1WPR9_LACSA|nr:hypothetical protein LSAT_V11C100007360 [Lactuca sativa]